MAFNMLAGLAGLGQFADYRQKQQAQDERTQMLRLTLQKFAQEQAKEKRLNEAGDAAASIGLGDLQGGGQLAAPEPNGGIAGLAGLEGSAPGAASRYSPTPGASGFASGLARLTALGVPPEVAQGAIDYMHRNESGTNSLAVNPRSGALGRAQWLGPRKAALIGRYGPQPSDDQQAEHMGSELQGSEGRTLANLLQAKTAKEGYDIWGRDFERPGPAALAKAGVGGAIRRAGAGAMAPAQGAPDATGWSSPPGEYGSDFASRALGGAGAGQPQPQQPQAQAGEQAGAALPSGISPPPPSPATFEQIAKAIRQKYPKMDGRTLNEAVGIAQKRLGPQYDAAFDRWKAISGFSLTASGQAETGRSNRVGEGQRDQTIGLTGQAQAETGRHNVANETAAQGNLVETQKRTDIMARGADAKTAKVQGEQKLATKQLRDLADQARSLHDAVEQNPNLVGTIGTARRLYGSVMEQGKMAEYDKQLAAYRSELKLFKAEIQKPLLGSRFFTKAGMEEITRLVPSLDTLDSPSEAKAALRGIAARLERKADDAEAAIAGVAADYDPGTGAPPASGAAREPAAAGAEPTARNPQTGEEVIFRNGQWVPLK